MKIYEFHTTNSKLEDLKHYLKLRWILRLFHFIMLVYSFYLSPLRQELFSLA